MVGTFAFMDALAARTGCFANPNVPHSTVTRNLSDPFSPYAAVGQGEIHDSARTLRPSPVCHCMTVFHILSRSACVTKLEGLYPDGRLDTSKRSG
jgi:hypothetical protein